MMEDPKTGGVVSVALIWFGTLYDFLGERLANISIVVGIIVGLVTIYCALARNRREQREYELRMKELRSHADPET